MQWGSVLALPRSGRGEAGSSSGYIHGARENRLVDDATIITGTQTRLDRLGHLDHVEEVCFPWRARALLWRS